VLPSLPHKTNKSTVARSISKCHQEETQCNISHKRSARQAFDEAFACVENPETAEEQQSNESISANEVDAIFKPAEATGTSFDAEQEEQVEGRNEDEEDIEARAVDMIKNEINDSSHNGYWNNNILFLMYCFQHDQELLSDAARTSLKAAWAGVEIQANVDKKQQLQQQKICDVALRKAVIELLSGTECPINFKRISGQRLLQYLLSLCSADGTQLLAIVGICL